MENHQHTCKLCNRSFPNGRSLGGHMRSHVITSQPLTPPLSPPTRRLRLTESSSPSPSASSSSDGSPSYGLRENPKRSFRLIDPDFDRESEPQSESDSSKVTRPRSTRTRRRLVPSDSDQDLALCLILLSRDSWIRPDREDRDSRSFENGEDGIQKKTKAVSKKRSVNGAIHQCPVCYRVFATGQALGGHKRAHFNADKKNVGDDEQASRSWTLKSVDLNLPPPEEFKSAAIF